MNEFVATVYEAVSFSASQHDGGDGGDGSSGG
jgi:hypothetical protein